MAQYIVPELLPEYTEVKVFPAEWFEDASGYYVDEISIEKTYGDIGGTFSLAPPNEEAPDQIHVGEHCFSRRDVSAFALRAVGVQPLAIKAIYHSNSADTRQMFGRVMNELDIASDGILNDKDLAQGIARAFMTDLFQFKAPTRQILADYESALTLLYDVNDGHPYGEKLSQATDAYVRLLLIGGESEPPAMQKIWSGKEFQHALGVTSRPHLALSWFMKQHIEDHIRVHGL